MATAIRLAENRHEFRKDQRRPKGDMLSDEEDVNIGPALASDIPKTTSDNDFSQYLPNMNNMDSLYIEPVTEEEIIQLVNNPKNKT